MLTPSGAEVKAQCGFAEQIAYLCLRCHAGEGDIPLEWNAGTNAYVYMVCNYLGGPLTQLPHVTPAQVSATSKSG
jgi:hypothetical protein